MNKYLEEAKAMRKSIYGLAEGQTDEKIINNKDAFPWWNGNGVELKAGQYIRYDDDVYQVIQNHTTQPDWTPDIVPALFNKITVEEWEKWEPGNFYKKGAKVTHNNKKWVSNVDNNHWEPGATGVYTWDEYIEENE